MKHGASQQQPLSHWSVNCYYSPLALTHSTNYTSAEWLLTAESKSTPRRRYCKRIDITLMSECLIADINMGQITEAKRLSIQWASSSGSPGWTPGCVGFHALVFAQIKQMTHKLVCCVILFVWHTNTVDVWTGFFKSKQGGHLYVD